MKHLDTESYFTTVAGKAAALRRPDAVTFELTYGCNLRCVHCYNPTHRALPHELTTIEILAILDQLASFGVLTVTFTGGEPSTRPDIGDIFRHARRHGLLVRLLTNATRITPKFLALLREVGIEQVCVSIYGATEPTYERMTAVPGSYSLFRLGLSMLAAARLPVVVRMPVTSINHHEIDACRDLMEALRFKFQYCFDLMPTVTGDQAPLQYRLSPEAKVRIDREMLGGRSNESLKEACPSHDSFIECACGRSRFAITPYGEMNLCTAFPIPRYDLRNGSVEEGWTVLKRTVDEARPNERYHCPTCTVRDHCRQGRVDAWLETGDMSVCLPHFKHWAESEHRAYALLDPRRIR